MKNIPPICTFPTQAWVIDDSKAHLDALQVKLSRENMTYQFFTSPQNALQRLNADYQISPFIDNLMQRIDETKYEHHIIELNIAELYKELYNPHRFERVSCVVVDYEMPGMDGVEFCQRIKDPYIQKILLTGAADQKIAIEAFNQGIIQHFLTKTHTDEGRLQEVLNEAQQNYFRQLSAPAYHCILRNNDLTTALREPKYKELVQGLIDRHHLVEYYLFEHTGSLIMMDDQGKACGLFIAFENSMNANEGADWNGFGQDSGVRADAKDGHNIVCYHQDSVDPHAGSPFPGVEERSKYLRPAHKVEGTYFESFFYAFVDDHIQLAQDSVLPFAQFKDKPF